MYVCEVLSNLWAHLALYMRCSAGSVHRAGPMPGTEGNLEDLYATARSQYAYFDPALKNAAFMENAGGSQVLLLHFVASTR